MANRRVGQCMTKNVKWRVPLWVPFSLLLCSIVAMVLISFLLYGLLGLLPGFPDSPTIRHTFIFIQLFNFLNYAEISAERRKYAVSLEAASRWVHATLAFFLVILSYPYHIDIHFGIIGVLVLLVLDIMSSYFRHVGENSPKENTDIFSPSVITLIFALLFALSAYLGIEGVYGFEYVLYALRISFYVYLMGLLVLNKFAPMFFFLLIVYICTSFGIFLNNRFGHSHYYDESMSFIISNDFIVIALVIVFIFLISIVEMIRKIENDAGDDKLDDGNNDKDINVEIEDK